MTNRRVTISVPEEIVAKAQRAVESGQSGSVSAYFTELAENEPDWADAELLATEILDEAGGSTPEDEAWVESVLGGGESSVESAA
ncbi:hypothetical protein [Nocardiopsis halotolerans]|uniref:hypothetical protein n=1 Tax=Nocardiopsis halotolerans TaxID=124252 RepID=UPI000349EB98|nr:hypothetical protein [Nocardiopsis halotolerans]